MDTIKVTGHTKTVNGKLVWVPEHDRHIEHSLDDDFKALLAHKKVQPILDNIVHTPKPEPKPEPPAMDAEADFQHLLPTIQDKTAHHKVLVAALAEAVTSTAPKPAEAPAPATDTGTKAWTPTLMEAMHEWIGHNNVGTHNKVYHVALFKGPDGKMHLVARWGKLGATPIQNVKATFTDFNKAYSAFTKLKNEKMGGGYHEADSDVWHKVEDYTWSPIQVQAPAAPAEPTPAPEPKFGEKLEYHHLKAGMHFMTGASEFEVMGKTDMHAVLKDSTSGHEFKVTQQAYETYGKGTLIRDPAKEKLKPGKKPTTSPSPAAPQSEGKSILDWKGQHTPVVSYGKTTVALNVGGHSPTAEIALDAGEDPKSIFKDLKELGLNVHWMPVKKKIQVSLGGMPSTGGKASAEKLHGYLKGAFGAPAPLQVGATKVENGKTYKLNANHKWELVASGPAPKPAQALPENFPFSQIGPQAGSNPGGLYQDKLGKKWYIKFPPSEDHAKNELLASKLYTLLGFEVPKVKIVKKDGKTGIASRFMEGLKADPKKLPSASGAAEGFGVDAWLGNWDAVGLNYDNMLLDAEGKAHRIDPGGALLYRAQGTAKGSDFGDEVTETKTFLDAATNPNTAHVFGKMTQAQKESAVARVLAVPDDVIRLAVEKFGPGTLIQKEALANKLIARKKSLAAQFPQANAIANPPLPDPSKIPVPKDSFPKAPNFKDWNGDGKGLSGNATINEQNQEAADKIYAVATAGNLTALKAMTTTPVGGGAAKPMGEHPSQHIRSMFQQCVETLEGLANPKATKTWDLDVYDGSDLQEICDAATSFSYGITKNNCQPGKRLGFWLHLATFEGAAALAPTKEFWTKNSDREKGKGIIGSYTTRLKSFLKAVKSYGEANKPYRDGKDYDDSGNKCRDVIADAYQFATEFEEGTKITKHIDFEDGMVQAFKNMQPGHIFQNPGSMCTSLKPDWNWSGEVHMEMIYAKGAKGIYNIGVGGFDNEGEITTLPGQRFMLLDWKDNGGKGGKKYLKVLMLPPDEAYVHNLNAKAVA